MTNERTNERLEEVSSHSLDITEQNIEKLKELFPEVLTEKKIDFDKLRLILGDEIETAPGIGTGVLYLITPSSVLSKRA